MRPTPTHPHATTIHRLPPPLARLLNTPIETRHNAAKALDRVMRERGMTAPDNPQRLAPTGDVAAALGRAPGEPLERRDLMEVVVGLLETMEPTVLSYDVE